MSDVVDAARALAEVPDVAEAVAQAREACTQLRWHQALRRRIPEAAAESRVRGAAASAELDGAGLPVPVVREIMMGAATWHTPLDPIERIVKGAVAATAETELLRGVVLRSPLQTLARLQTLAAADHLSADQLGRPRAPGEECREFSELGPAPAADLARARLAGVVDLLGAMDTVPVPVVVALVHAELVHARPFVSGNGIVARALERLLVQAGGLDPTGVAVTEAGHGALGGPAYLGALTAYGRGDQAGVGLWLVHGARALAAAAAQGQQVADAVLAGRLT